MTDLPTVDCVEDIDATVGIVDGRVAMSAQVTTDVRVGAPEHTPLSAHEPHLTLRVAADDVRVVLDFDGDGLGELADALAGVQEDP